MTISISKIYVIDSSIFRYALTLKCEFTFGLSFNRALPNFSQTLKIAQDIWFVVTCPLFAKKIQKMLNLNKAAHHVQWSHDDGQLVHGRDLSAPCVQIKAFSEFWKLRTDLTSYHYLFVTFFFYVSTMRNSLQLPKISDILSEELVCDRT